MSRLTFMATAETLTLVPLFSVECHRRLTMPGRIDATPAPGHTIFVALAGVDQDAAALKAWFWVEDATLRCVAKWLKKARASSLVGILAPPPA